MENIAYMIYPVKVYSSTGKLKKIITTKTLLKKYDQDYYALTTRGTQYWKGMKSDKEAKKWVKKADRKSIESVYKVKCAICEETVMKKNNRAETCSDRCARDFRNKKAKVKYADAKQLREAIV
jgi:hypothetical protein